MKRAHEPSPTTRRAAAADELLVLRAQLGEEAAFAALVRRTSGVLLSYLRRRVGAETAQDLLQQTWLKAHRGLPRLEDPGAFRSWMFQIAHREAASHRRRPEERLAEATVGLDDADLPAVGGDATHRLDLQGALALLPPERREMARLRFGFGLSYKELAGLLGLEIGTVRSRLHALRQELRAALDRGREERER